MHALWALSEGRHLAAGLAEAGLPAMALRGPEVQQRIFDNAATFMSGDLDLLVRAGDLRQVATWLEGHGFRSHPTNGALRRLAGRAMYERNGFAVDLHRLVEVPPYPTWLFRRLTHELWRGASVGPGGFVQPRMAALTVYLAVHAAGSGAEAHDPRSVSARAAAERVDDPEEVWRLARRLGVADAVRAVLDSRAPTSAQVVEGRGGTAAWWLGRAMRGDLLPPRWRARAREVVSYRRHGLRPFAPRKAWSTVEGERMQIWEGVCGPGSWTGDLIDAWLGGVRDSPAPVLVEVGTGSGALAILAQMRAPNAEIHGTDLSRRAIGNATANARLHHRDIALHEGDLFAPLPRRLVGAVDAVLAHLPTLAPGSYRDDDDGDPREDWAPTETYVGVGGDGLDLMRRLLATSPPWLAPTGTVVISMRAWQWDGFRAEAEMLGFAQRQVISPSPTGVIVVLERVSPPGG